MAAGGVIVYLFVSHSSQIAFDSMYFLRPFFSKQRILLRLLDLIDWWSHLYTTPAQFRSHLSFSCHKFCGWTANELFPVAESALCGLLHMLIHITNVPDLNGATWRMIGLIVRHTSRTQRFANKLQMLWIVSILSSRFQSEIFLRCHQAIAIYALWRHLPPQSKLLRGYLFVSSCKFAASVAFECLTILYRNIISICG